MSLADKIFFISAGLTSLADNRIVHIHSHDGLMSLADNIFISAGLMSLADNHIFL